MNSNNFFWIIIFVPMILGFISGKIGKVDEWYMKKLKKPPLNPPNFIFPIVWSILYLLMGISYYYGLYDKSYIYWTIPIIHLILNFSYSPIFFYFKKILAAAIITTLILITALMVMYQFYYYSGYKIAAYLLIPYIFWLLFANYLAWSIYFINK